MYKLLIGIMTQLLQQWLYVGKVLFIVKVLVLI